jgi:hypothetical protein
MANHPDYDCTGCGQSTKRELLTVKKVVFTEMGEGARTVKSRVTDWLCPRCTATDVDFNREPFSPKKAVALRG